MHMVKDLESSIGGGREYSVKYGRQTSAWRKISEMSAQSEVSDVDKCIASGIGGDRVYSVKYRMWTSV